MSTLYTYEGGSEVLTISGTSVRSGSENTRKACRIVSTTDCWFKFGGDDVVAVKAAAGNHFLPANVEIFVRPFNDSNTYIAFIQDTTGGVVSLSLITAS